MVFPTRFPPPSTPRGPPGQQPPATPKGPRNIKGPEEDETDALERLEEQFSKMRGKRAGLSTFRRVRVRADIEEEIARSGSSLGLDVHRDPVPGEEPQPPSPDNRRPHASPGLSRGPFLR